MCARIVSFALCATLLGGCAHLGTPEGGSAAGAKPVSFTDANAEARGLLRCVGKQVEAFSEIDQKPFVIAVGTFRNMTVSVSNQPLDVPLEITTAVEAALSQISPLVTYTDLLRRPVPDWAVDQVTRPDLFLEGGIFIQERVASTDSSNFDISIGFGAVDLRASRKTQSSIAGVELDMNATLPKGKRSGYGFAAPVRVAFDRMSGVQTSFAGSVADIAIGAENIKRQVTSYSQGLRLAVAHQVARIIGRWQALPGYWLCTGGEPDDIVKDDRLGRWQRLIASGDMRTPVSYLQDLLAYNGRIIPKTAVIDRTTVGALSDFMVSRGRIFDPNDLEAAYWELLLGVATQPLAVLNKARAWERGQEATAREAASKPAEVVRQPSQSRPSPSTSYQETTGLRDDVKPRPALTPADLEVDHSRVAAAAAATPSAPSKGAEAPVVSLVAPDQTQRYYQRGDSLNLELRVSADSYVYCYLLDERGLVQRFLPNRDLLSARLAAGEALRVPGSMRFALAASDRGMRERIGCFATPTDILDALPKRVRGIEFQPLRGISTLEQVRAVFEQVASSSLGVVFYTIEVR